VELAKPGERKISPKELLAMTEADEAAEDDGSPAEAKPAGKKPRRQTSARRSTARPRKGEQE
jgi:hypothetical protein